MPWLQQQAQQAGVSLQRQRVRSLAQLADCQLLVNCSGLGAAQLFGDDQMQAVRGQVVRVRAPWVRNYYNIDGKFYIIPNVDTLVLGGTVQPGDHDTQPRQSETDYILQGCSQLLPSLRHAEVVTVWAGLRPGRCSVRLEVEERGDWGEVAGEERGAGGPVRLPPVVHNYGHGGAGLTLHWGCAEDVAELTEQVLSG